MTDRMTSLIPYLSTPATRSSPALRVHLGELTWTTFAAWTPQVRREA